VPACIAGVTSDTCIALRSRASLLIALRQARVAGAALRIASISGTCATLRIAGIGGTCAALRIAGIGGTCAALRIAGLTSVGAGRLPTARVAGPAGSAVSNRARITLRPRTGIVAGQSDVCAGADGDRLGSSQLNIEIKLVCGRTGIMLPRNALRNRYLSILLHEYPGPA
jgi:hypothetical protein